MRGASQRFWRDPRMPHVESRRASHSRACYKPHSHPTFSIGAVDAGSSVFSGAGGSLAALRPGCLVFVPPDCVHACNPSPDSSWSYQMLHLEARWLETWRRTDAGPVGGPAGPGGIWITDDGTLYHQFCRLNDLLFSAAAPAAKDAALKAFLADSHAGHHPRLDMPAPRQGYAERLAPALAALSEADPGDASVRQLAGLCGMSPYQFIRAFRACTGLTPHAWRLNQRINQARSDIRAGQDIALTAYQHGFADQSHFHRTFKAFMAATPGQYKA